MKKKEKYLYTTKFKLIGVHSKCGCIGVKDNFTSLVGDKYTHVLREIASICSNKYM